MKRVVLISPRAEADIQNGRNWYEKHQVGLGARFVNEIGQAILVLQDDADRFPIYYRSFRRILLHRFPYKIFFILENDRVLIFRVLHAKRKHQWLLPVTPKD